MNIAEVLAGQHPIILFFILLAFMAIGDFVSQKTKAFLPSILVFCILILASSWSGLIPTNIFSLVGLVAPFTTIISLFTVVNMGTSMDVDDIVKNGKVVLVGLGAIVGVAGFILLVGTPIFGWETAVISTPVVAGGIVASLEMQAAARAIGNDGLAVVAALILAFQSFPGFILTPILLKKSMKKELERNKSLGATPKIEKAAPVKCKVPDKYLSNATLLAMVAFIGALSVLSTEVTRMFMGNFAISASIFGLIYGVLFSAFGFVPKATLKRASSNGFVLILLMLNAFGILAQTSFEAIKAVAIPVAGTMALGIVGIFIVCSIVAKVLKMDWELAVALGLNCLLGFPLNYQLTIEAIGAVTDDPETAKYLEDKYMPMMLVAGFVIVTIGSVILAGFMKNLL